MKNIFTLLLLISAAASADAPKIIYKEGKPLAGFDLQQGKQPCKKGEPCLFFHKDSDDLRLIIEGKSIRMAYKSKEKEPVPFPKNFKSMEPQDKTDAVKAYRDFFKNELAFMLQAFVYTAPEIFDWSIDKFKAEQDKHLISEQELSGIFMGGLPPELYTVFKIKCKGGENIIFESDGGGNVFMEVE